MDDITLQRQRPLGLSDLFGQQAAAWEALNERLRYAYTRWGYKRVVLPTLAYYRTVSTQASEQLRQSTYRFVDREGHVLALRPDMTVPTARLVGASLYDQPLPLRLYYSGNVFRYTKPQAGQRREFTQLGIELIGADTVEADAEVVTMAVATLQALDTPAYQVNLGQVEYVRGLLQGQTLDADQLARLEQAISRKSPVEIDNTLRALGIGSETATAIRALPTLSGGPEVLARARALTSNPDALAAVDRLETLWAALRVRGCAKHVTLDLGEVREMGYYTGITFHGYVEGLGFHVINGGRYDGLLGNFGPDLPAVGFAVGIERALLVSSLQVDLAPDIVMPGCANPACHQIAAEARAMGLIVETDLLGRNLEEFITLALSRGAHRVVYGCGEGHWAVQDRDTRIELSLDDLLQEMRQWTR